MKTDFRIIPPTRPGEPATIDCSVFQNLGEFQDSLEATFATSFSGSSIEELTKKSKSAFGFASIFAPLAALAYAAGASAGKASATLEAAVAASRATSIAAAASNAAPTFAGKVREQVGKGMTKSAAISFVAREFPQLHAQYVRTGGGAL